MKKLFLITFMLLTSSLASPKTFSKSYSFSESNTLITSEDKIEYFVWSSPSDSLVEMIKRHEGLKLKAYKCPAGKKTIGYGHRTKSLNQISLETANKLLLSDLKKVDKELSQLVPENLSERQYEALLSFCYNVGVNNFRKSTLRRLILENPYNPAIIDEFGKWRKGGGRVLNGLVKRRKDEAAMYYPNYLLELSKKVKSWKKKTSKTR